MKNQKFGKKKVLQSPLKRTRLNSKIKGDDYETFNTHTIHYFSLGRYGLGPAKPGKDEQNKQQMMEMMQDSTMRAMMMEHVAQNPEMCREMMTHMRKQMKDNVEEMDRSAMMQRMQQIRDNPEMKERMQKHMQMMQMHMMCMQMMQGGMMDGNKPESDDHDQHH